MTNNNFKIMIHDEMNQYTDSITTQSNYLKYLWIVFLNFDVSEDDFTNTTFDILFDIITLL